MHPQIYIAVLLIWQAGISAFADGLLNGWTINVGCTANSPIGAPGTFQASRNGGLSTSGGACKRTNTNFTEVSFSSSTGGVARSNKLYAVQTGEFLIVPPIQSNEYQPIFAVNTKCPTADKTMNYLYVQWNDGAVALSDTYLMGTADITTAGGVTLKTQYDIGGALYWGGSRPLSTADCVNGVTEVQGSNNLGGRIYWTANEGGIFKTNPGRATFFLPAKSVALSTFGGKTFHGITFDSSTSTLGILPDAAGDVRNIQAVSSPTGSSFAIRPYSDPASDTLDASSTAYLDTVTLKYFNSPKAGMFRGTVTRTGNGAQCASPPCTGRIACLARASGGSGYRIICSGESPLDRSIPYNITLFRPYTCPEGYVSVPKDNDVDVTDDFCVAKYEMKNVSGVAASVKDGAPWVGIDRNGAITACQALGPGFDLVTTAEWQTIARSAEDSYENSKWANWSNGSKLGTNYVNRGHSDNAPAQALAASTDEDPCYGTGNPGCADGTKPDYLQKRTHKLANGSVVWDLGGNAAEWMKDNNFTPQGADDQVALSPEGAERKKRWGPKGNYSTGTTPKLTAPYGGLGFSYLNASAGGITRGGGYTGLTTAGIFNAILQASPLSTAANVGFRCAYHTYPVQNAADFGFSQLSWNAGTIAQNTSTTKDILLINSGFESGTFAISKSGSAAFVLQEVTCPNGSTLAPGESCTARIAFSPTTAGGFSGALIATWTSAGIAGNRSSQVILSGTTPASLAFSTNAFAAGTVGVGSSITSGDIVLTNGGAAAATMTSALSVTGAGMSLSTNTCPGLGGTLAAGATCTIQIRFLPAATGAISGAVSANWTSPGLTGTQLSQVASVTGTGGIATASVYRGKDGTKFLLTLNPAEITAPYTMQLGGARAFGLLPDTSSCSGGTGVLVYRCVKNETGTPFLSTRLNCLQDNPEGTLHSAMGYACTGATSGMVPLYRFWALGVGYLATTNVNDAPDMANSFWVLPSGLMRRQIYVPQ
jgi:hypothetical protein